MLLPFTPSSPAQGGDDTYPASVIAEAETETPIVEAVARKPAEAARRKPKVYRYSVIPGGAHSAQELADAIERDAVVADHYRAVSAGAVHAETVKDDREAYVSYRMGNRIYWTKNKVRLHAGEKILTDGITEIRARCGNCISTKPMAPTADNEPEPLELDALLTGEPDALPSTWRALNIETPGRQGTLQRSWGAEPASDASTFFPQGPVFLSNRLAPFPQETPLSAGSFLRPEVLFENGVVPIGGSFPTDPDNGSLPTGSNNGSLPTGSNNGSFPTDPDNGSFPTGSDKGPLPSDSNDDDGPFPSGSTGGSFPTNSVWVADPTFQQNPIGLPDSQSPPLTPGSTDLLLETPLQSSDVLSPALPPATDPPAPQGSTDVPLWAVTGDPNLPTNVQELLQGSSEAQIQVPENPLATPEPGTMLLVGSGVVTFALRRRRSRANSSH